MTILIDIVFAGFLLTTLSVIALDSISFVVFPELPILMSSVIPSGRFYTTSLQALCLMYNIYMIIILHWTIFIAYVYVLLIHVFFVVPFVSKEFTLNRKSYKSSWFLRNPTNLRLELRAVQILQFIFNKAVGVFLYPLQILCTVSFIFSTFTIIKQRNDLSMEVFAMTVIWSVATSVPWALFLIIGGYLHSNAGKISSSWKCYKVWRTSSERREMNKFQLSCKPITFNYGTFYVIRRVSVLIYVRVLTRGLVRALLTLKIN